MNTQNIRILCLDGYYLGIRLRGSHSIFLSELIIAAEVISNVCVDRRFQPIEVN